MWYMHTWDGGGGCEDRGIDVILRMLDMGWYGDGL